MTVLDFWNTKDIAVHCNTKEKYNRFINRLIEVIDWDWGFPAWEKCSEEKTCISSGMIISNESTFRQLGDKIIEFEELDEFREGN